MRILTRCIRCGKRDALPEAARLASSAEFQFDVPEGLCISCLAKDPAVQAKLRARREPYLRKLRGPGARIRDSIERGVEAIRDLARRLRAPSAERSEHAKQMFERQLAAPGVSLKALTPSAGVSHMVTFYRDTRFSNCDPERGDMLLFQWGTYDRGQGEHFELDITRQLALIDSAVRPDADIWQLSLTFMFPGIETLRGLGSWNKWCASPAEVDDFNTFVRGHTAYTAVSDRSDGGVRLDYEQVE